MSDFAERMWELSAKKNSVLVVGLDPDLRYFPDYLLKGYHGEQQVEEIIFHFNRIIIEEVAPYAVAVKPQLAFYEMWGSCGVRALERTISYARDHDLTVIGDAKRNDVDFVAEAYAQAYLGNGPLGVDAVTVTPYLGTDGLYPFLNKARREDKGIFVVLKTSNSSAGEVQNLVTEDGRLLYERIASFLGKMMYEGEEKEEGYSALGVVVGATYPEDARRIRLLLPDSIFLVPGFGAQGAEAGILKGYFDKQGMGALVNSSRGIIFAYTHQQAKERVTEKEVRAAVAEAARRDQKKLNEVRFP